MKLISYFSVKHQRYQISFVMSMIQELCENYEIGIIPYRHKSGTLMVLVEDDKNDDVIVDVNTCTVTCSGTSAVLKVNGGYKTLTAKVYDSNNNDVTNDYNLFDWSFYIDDESINDKIYIVKNEVHNIVRVKFIGDESYMGKIIEAKCLCAGSNNVEGAIKIEVSCL